MLVHAIQLHVQYLINAYNNVMTHWIWLFEMVLHIQEKWIFLEGRYIIRHIGNSHHIRGIFYQLAGVTMVGMIVVGTHSNDNIGIPFPDFTNYLQTDMQVRLQFAVVVVKHGIFINSIFFGRILCLSASSLSQNPTPFFVMTSVTVGKGDEFNGDPHLCKECCGSAHFHIAIIWMCKNGYHPYSPIFFILGIELY